MAFPPVPFQEWFLRQTSTGNAALNAYVARVKADGGVVEAIGCVPLAVWDWAAPAAPTLLLDLFPNAAAAYSLRKLRAAYSGAAVRVRESGGNTEADIGFTSAGELDTSALLAHCGANDGFVTVWYDQSLSNNATQTTAANQPKIVSAGSLVTENGKPAVEFDGVNDQLLLSSSLGDVESTSFLIMKSFNTAEDVPYARGQYYTITMNPSVNSFEFRDFVNTVDQSANVTALSQFVASLYRSANSASLQIAIDGTIQADTGEAGRVSFGSGSIGSASGAWWWNGRVQEIIEYNSDQSSNRTGIETNINDFYSIYP